MKKEEKNKTEEQVLDQQEVEIVDEDIQNDAVKKLEDENAQLNDRLLRLMAEFDNFKKRTQKEKLETYGNATASCVENFLGIIDNFERALTHETTDENYKRGMQMIFGMFLETLTSLGVSEIQCEGKQFDPNYHNAVNKVEDENLPENTISQVFQKGYMLGDKVIRHAMVVVANAG